MKHFESIAYGEFRWGGYALAALLLSSVLLAADPKSPKTNLAGEANASSADETSAQPPRSLNRDDIAAASLEELLQVKVTSLSRRPQTLSQTAGAVQVITSEEIRRSGITSLPDLFRLVPGLSVSQVDGSKYAVSSRGFLDRFANKMLVMIDGRSIYNNVFSGVMWEHYNLLVQDIDRIEVVRGPGARSWGPNAVNGVINIITRPPEDQSANGVSFGSGNTEHALIGARMAGRLASNLQGSVSMRIARGGANRLLDGPSADDGLDTQRGTLRLEWANKPNQKISFLSDLYRGNAEQWLSRTVRRSAPWMAQREPLSIDGGSATLRWEQTTERTQISFQTFFMQENRREVTLGAFKNSVLDFDLQGEWHIAPRQSLLWGAGYRHFNNRLWNGRSVSFTNAENSNQMGSAFAEYEWELVPEKLRVAAGTKLLNETLSGVQTQPGIRLSYTPHKDLGAWASVSRAYRTLSLRDVNLSTRIPARDVLPDLYVDYAANKSLLPEAVTAYEAGVRKAWGNLFSVDIASYYSSYSRLTRWKPTAAVIAPNPDGAGNILLVPFTSSNSAAARGRGIEANSHWNLSRTLQLSGGYGYGTTSFWDFVGAIPSSLSQIPTSPGLFLHSRVAWDFHRKWSFDSWATRTSGWDKRTNTTNLRWDSRLSFRPVPEWEVSAVLRNALKKNALEYNIGDFAVGSVTPRGIFVQLQRRF